jgi:hypothetical protein
MPEKAVKNSILNSLFLHCPACAEALAYCRSESDALDSYSDFLSSLAGSRRVLFVPLRDFKKSGSEGRIIAGIRHDMDGDLTTALRMARAEKRMGISSTYYVLHTERSYGHWKNGKFIRNPFVLSIIKSIQNLGHEIGFHNNALEPLIAQGILPEKTLEQELDHLRRGGIRITGTSSHGSYYLYGADNNEIFEGYTVGGRREFTDFSGKKHSLGQVRMKDHGLEYEANFLLGYKMADGEMYKSVSPFKKDMGDRFREIPMYERDYDGQYGVFGRDAWVINPCPRNGLSPWIKADVRQAIEHITSLQEGMKIIIDVHPVYYGSTFVRRSLRKVIGSPKEKKPRRENKK